MSYRLVISGSFVSRKVSSHGVIKRYGWGAGSSPWDPLLQDRSICLLSITEGYADGASELKLVHSPSPPTIEALRFRSKLHNLQEFT